MGVLNSWQRISRVLPLYPFGDGRDGPVTISADTTIPTTESSCSGSIGTTQLNVTDAVFSNGDVIEIWQPHGSGNGSWEINSVSLGGGTNTLTLSQALVYDYVDSGVNQAVARRVPLFTTLTIDSGQNYIIPAWDGNKGGGWTYGAQTETIINGILYGQGKGGRGGTPSTDTSAAVYGNKGESQNAFATTGFQASNVRQDMGAGGGQKAIEPSNFEGAGGGGAGHRTAGSDGIGIGSTPGQGGSTGGSADGTNKLMGAGGGANGLNKDGAKGKDGGRGGACFTAFSKIFTVNSTTGSVNLVGDPGQSDGSGFYSGSGAGSGGFALIVCQTATGLEKINASGGIGGSSNNAAVGGNGGSGGVAVHHYGATTGTSTPAQEDITDSSLTTTTTTTSTSTSTTTTSTSSSTTTTSTSTSRTTSTSTTTTSTSTSRTTTSTSTTTTSTSSTTTSTSSTTTSTSSSTTTSTSTSTTTTWVYTGFIEKM